MTSTTTNQSGPTSDEDERRARAATENRHVLVALLLIFFGFPLSLYILVQLGSWLGIQALWAPPTIEPWGTGTTVRFVGGLRTNTQVTTDQKTDQKADQKADQKTVLLEGIANVPLASVVEKRQSFWGSAVCVKDTPLCWSVLGRLAP